MAKSYLHTVVNYLRLPKPDKNTGMPYLCPHHQQVLNSAKFCGSRRILQLCSEFCILRDFELSITWALFRVCHVTVLCDLKEKAEKQIRVTQSGKICSSCKI